MSKRLPKDLLAHAARIKEHFEEREAIEAEQEEMGAELVRQGCVLLGSMQKLCYESRVAQPQLSRALHGQRRLALEAYVRIAETLARTGTP